MEGVTKKSRVDRISALPDSLIQHILSFLPSTQESIRTCILSKRWKDQWTRVPVLVFKSSGMSAANFLTFTGSVLFSYDSFKVRKFCVEYDHDPTFDPLLFEKIRFATRINVEELILNCNKAYGSLMFPEFVFRHASLTKLHTVGCNLIPHDVKWKCLLELSLTYCKLPNEGIESILSGSPLLKSLEIRLCYGCSVFSIFSNSLKRCVLVDQQNFEISCPNLEEFTIRRSDYYVLNVSNHVIENVLSRSRLLRSLELSSCIIFDQLVIASKSLRRLVLKDLDVFKLDISCPNMKELKLEDLKNVRAINLKN